MTEKKPEEEPGRFMTWLKQHTDWVSPVISASIAGVVLALAISCLWRLSDYWLATVIVALAFFYGIAGAWAASLYALTVHKGTHEFKREAFESKLEAESRLVAFPQRQQEPTTETH
jgi:hypothetical protein